MHYEQKFKKQDSIAKKSMGERNSLYYTNTKVNCNFSSIICILTQIIKTLYIRILKFRRFSFALICCTLKYQKECMNSGLKRLTADQLSRATLLYYPSNACLSFTSSIDRSNLSNKIAKWFMSRIFLLWIKNLIILG